MILNQTLLPESRCLQITDHNQHCHQTVSCREDYRNKKVPLYQVGPAYHAPGVISHFQELHVDVETNSYEGYTPADAKIALEMTKQLINNPTSKSKNANDLKGRKSIFSIIFISKNNFSTWDIETRFRRILISHFILHHLASMLCAVAKCLN